MSNANCLADFGIISELLSQQLSHYQQLLKLAGQKRDALVNLKTDELEKLVNAENMLLKKLAALEKKRQTASEHIIGSLGLAGPKTLAELIPYADAPQQTELSRLHTEFSALAPQLFEANQANRLLLQTNMELNELMLNLMSAPEDPLNNFYGADGNEAEEKISGPSIFDQQI